MGNLNCRDGSSEIIGVEVSQKNSPNHLYNENALDDEIQLESLPDPTLVQALVRGYLLRREPNILESSRQNQSRVNTSDKCLVKLAQGDYRGLTNVRGEPHGKGKLVSELFTYKGTWTEGKMEGNGLCAYHNGDTYSGEWVSNKKEGPGEMKFHSEVEYKGE